MIGSFFKKFIEQKNRRVRTPVFLQMDSAECGSTALAIILAFFGRHILPSEVREACDVTRDGAKAINIIKAARQYGLEAHGMQQTLEDVQLLPPPFIVYWQFNHFLVVDGFGAGKVYLNDPATGPRTVTEEEFDQGFTGIVLFMAPGENFQTDNLAEPSFLKLLWQRLQGSRWSFFYIVFVALAFAIPALSLAFFAKILIDDILLAGRRDWLTPLLFSMSAAALLMGTLTGVKRHYLSRLYTKLQQTGAADFFWRILQLPLSFFQQRAIGDIAERIESHYPLAAVLTDELTSCIVGFITMIFCGVILFFLNAPLAVISILIAVVNFLLLWIVSRRMTDLSRRCAQAIGKLSGIEMNGIQIIETLKANAVEDHFFTRWAAFHAQKLESQQRLQNYTSFIKILPIFLKGINLIFLLTLGSWFIMENQLTVGTLIAIQIVLMSFNQQFSDILTLSEQFYKIKGNLARINDVEQHPLSHVLSHEDHEKEIFLPEKSAHPVLALRDIEFGYSRLEPPIFSKLSLTIKEGERVAIVGPTGGGKSSLAKLICGLYAPWSGEILLQGVPLREITRQTLSHFVGMVDQQIFLFSATVRENLTLWNPHISDERIYEALKTADIADVVMERGGLECWVEERGKNFSGGQVQRLEIARALVGNPKLLILDEATSALDPIVEQRIYDNLRRSNCTLLIIAHRLSAVRDCDRIIVIHEGYIEQEGQHASLIQDSGLYKDLVSLEIQ